MKLQHIVPTWILLMGLSLTACVPPPLTPSATEAILPTDTLTPSASPIPSPTSWLCTSYRSGKVRKGNIPGDVKIDIPLQGAINLPSNQTAQDVQVSGTHTGIPAGMYLWVFVYSPDAGLHGRYYPQTRDALRGWQPEPTTGMDGKWTLNIGFGASNLCYEIIVMVADARASQSIADQLIEWASLDNYAGYEVDGPPSATPPEAPALPDGLVEKASIEVMTK